MFYFFKQNLPKKQFLKSFKTQKTLFKNKSKSVIKIFKIKRFNNELQNEKKENSLGENTTKLFLFNLFSEFFSANVSSENFFLRKNKIFIKSKHSKIRVFVKNIVLFALALNIIFIVELNSLYYNITLNIGYFIYFLYALLFCLSIKILFLNKNFIFKQIIIKLNFLYLYKQVKWYINQYK